MIRRKKRGFIEFETQSSEGFGERASSHVPSDKVQYIRPAITAEARLALLGTGIAANREPASMTA
jgi:hypothetical protein